MTQRMVSGVLILSMNYEQMTNATTITSRSFIKVATSVILPLESMSIT